MNARPRDEAEGETRIEPHMARRGDTNKRIVGAHAAPGRLAVDIGFEVATEELSIPLIDFYEASNGRIGILERLGGDWRRGQECGMHLWSRHSRRNGVFHDSLTAYHDR